jgi:hypothetical protein
MIGQISFIAIVAIGLVVFIGTSLTPAAFAFPQGVNTVQSIRQANYCFEAGCSNQAVAAIGSIGIGTTEHALGSVGP